jgi:hypothetical protein
MKIGKKAVIMQKKTKSCGSSERILKRIPAVAPPQTRGQAPLTTA